MSCIRGARRHVPFYFLLLSVHDVATELFACLVDGSLLSSCFLYESLLQLAYFALESFNFLPAVERSSVVVAQTLYQSFLRLLNLHWHLLHLLALLELLAQIHDLLANAVVRSV